MRWRSECLEHRRVEIAALDVDVGRRSAALVEREREVAAVDRAGQQAVGMLTDPIVRNRYSGRSGHAGYTAAGAAAAPGSSPRWSSSFPSSNAARKTIAPTRQIPHCALVSGTVSKIRCNGDSAVTRNVSGSAAP